MTIDKFELFKPFDTTKEDLPARDLAELLSSKLAAGKKIGRRITLDQGIHNIKPRAWENSHERMYVTVDEFGAGMVTLTDDGKTERIKIDRRTPQLLIYEEEETGSRVRIYGLLTWS